VPTAQTLEEHRARMLTLVQEGRGMDLMRNSSRADHREQCRLTSERLRQRAEALETAVKISSDADRLLPVFPGLYRCVDCELGALEHCAAAERKLRGWEPL
jgi:hypothetical protein